MKTLITSLAISSLSFFAFTQTITLPETIISKTYDYSNADKSKNRCANVKKLEQALLNFDHSNIAALYDIKSDIYEVTFKTPKGKIVASFNKNGKIIKTNEVYENIRLPLSILHSIAEKFPQYTVLEDKYLVKYNFNSLNLKQEYEITLKKDKTLIKLKTNAKGDFI